MKKSLFAILVPTILTLTVCLLYTPAQAGTFTVTGTAGDTSAGSLGAAVNGASGDGAITSDTISFNSSFSTPQAITLTGAYLAISKNSGYGVTVNDPGSLLTLNGGANSLFNISGGGTLSLTDLSLASGAVAVGSNSSLSLNNVSVATNITGLGGIAVNGGTVSLTGNNSSLSGGITLNSGTLSFNNINSLGSNASTLTLNGGTLQAAVTYMDVLSLPSVLGQSIDVGAAGATIDADGGSRVRLSGLISGLGGLTFITTGGTGIIILSQHNITTIGNTYSGGSTLIGVTVQEENGYDLGTGTVVMDGATLESFPPNAPGAEVQDIYLMSAGATLTNFDGVGGNISGLGGVVYNGYSDDNYTAFITGNNTYTGGTTILYSYVPIADNAAAFGSAGSTIFMQDSAIYAADISLGQSFQVSSAVTLDARNSVTLTGGISGSGSVIYGSTSFAWGTWDLTAANSYTGGSEIGYGVVDLVGSGSLGTGGLTVDTYGGFDISAASGAVTLPFLAGAGWVSLGGNRLVEGGDNSNQVFSGDIVGTGGSFVKNGTGILALSGANSFTGGFLLNSGTVLAGSSSALGTGSVTLAGGTLGMLFGPRTLVIGGNYTQNAGATLALGLTTAFPYDQLHVDGNASLSGALTLFDYSVNTPVSGQSFLILQTDGTLSGRFSSESDPFTTVRMLPVYESNEVFLVAVLPSFTNLAVTPNEKAVAAALDKAFGSAGTQDLTISLGQQNSTTLPTDYDQIAPTGLLPVFQMGFATAQAQGEMMVRHFAGDMGDAPGMRTASRWPQGQALFAGNLPAGDEAGMGKTYSDGGWSLFMERQDLSDSVAGDSNAPGYQFVSSGLSAGIENHLTRDIVVGFLLGYGQSNTVPGNNGSVNATDGQAGLYGGWRNDGTYVEASGSVGLDRYQTQRPTYGGYTAGSTSGYQFSGQAGLGHDWALGPTRLGLFATGQATYVAIDGFTESGSLAPLTFGAQGETSVLSDLGARAGRQWTLGDFTFEPGLTLAWEHRYQGNADSLSAGFSGNDPFTVTGPDAWADALAVGAGLEVKVAQVLAFSLQYRDLLAFGNGGSQGFTSGIDFGF